MRYRAEHGENHSYVVDTMSGERVGVHHGPMKEEAAEDEANFRNMIQERNKPGKYEEKAREIGIDGYIVKALHTPSEVLKVVEDLYSNKKTS